ncbi:MAG: helix-turn-helix transcriptional regulator [Chthoniobacterales bacterium]
MASRKVIPNRTRISRALGDVLRNYRKRSKLSQEELGEEVGLSTNYIGNLERGEYEVSLSTLNRIAKFFGLKLSEILKEAGY